jgi:hypothetical protein
MHIWVSNHMIDEYNRIITDLNERTDELTDRIRTTPISIWRTVNDYGEEAAKQWLDADREKLNDYMLEQENTFKNAYATTQWKSVRTVIQEAVLLPEDSDEYQEPEKVLYRRLRKWIKTSKLAAIREKFWLEIVPGASGYEAKQKLLLDTFKKEYMVHLRDDMQEYAATQIHHDEPLEDNRWVKHSKITKCTGSSGPISISNGTRPLSRVGNNQVDLIDLIDLIAISQSSQAKSLLFKDCNQIYFPSLLPR